MFLQHDLAFSLHTYHCTPKQKLSHSDFKRMQAQDNPIWALGWQILQSISIRLGLLLLL